MYLIGLIISGLLFISNANYLHSIHISFGEVDFLHYEINAKVTFYKDDFLLGLKNSRGESLKYLKSKDYDELKLNYLKAHFNVIVNRGKKLPLIITGNNENESTIWFNIKFTSDEKINSLEITNDILVNEFRDQMNLFNIKTLSGEQSFIFNKSKQKFSIKF